LHKGGEFAQFLLLLQGSHMFRHFSTTAGSSTERTERKGATHHLPFSWLLSLKSVPCWCALAVVRLVALSYAGNRVSRENLDRSRRVIAHLHEWRMVPRFHIPVNDGVSPSFLPLSELAGGGTLKGQRTEGVAARIQDWEKQRRALGHMVLGRCRWGSEGGSYCKRMSIRRGLAGGDLQNVPTSHLSHWMAIQRFLSEFL
jgi:hypothetical protein